MKKFILALVFCSLFSACETFNKAAYTEIQKQQYENEHKFNSAINPAEKLSKENYPTYEEYIRAKKLARKQSHTDKDD